MKLRLGLHDQGADANDRCEGIRTGHFFWNILPVANHKLFAPDRQAMRAELLHVLDFKPGRGEPLHLHELEVCRGFNSGIQVQKFPNWHLTFIRT
jgi:hypothetical protein